MRSNFCFLGKISRNLASAELRGEVNSTDILLSWNPLAFWGLSLQFQYCKNWLLQNCLLVFPEFQVPPLTSKFSGILCKETGMCDSQGLSLTPSSALRDKPPSLPGPWCAELRVQSDPCPRIVQAPYGCSKEGKLSSNSCPHLSCLFLNKGHLWPSSRHSKWMSLLVFSPRESWGIFHVTHQNQPLELILRLRLLHWNWFSHNSCGWWHGSRVNNKSVRAEVSSLHHTPCTTLSSDRPFYPYSSDPEGTSGTNGRYQTSPEQLARSGVCCESQPSSFFPHLHKPVLRHGLFQGKER